MASIQHFSILRSNKWTIFLPLKPPYHETLVILIPFNQKFQVPNMEVLNLIWQSCGWVFAFLSLTYSLYRWGFLHFRYLKCLVNFCYLAATNLLKICPKVRFLADSCYQVVSKMFDVIPYTLQNREEFDPCLTWNIDLTGLKLDQHLLTTWSCKCSNTLFPWERCSNDLGPHEFEPAQCHQLKVNKEAVFFGGIV